MARLSFCKRSVNVRSDDLVTEICNNFVGVTNNEMPLSCDSEQQEMHKFCFKILLIAKEMG